MGKVYCLGYIHWKDDNTTLPQIAPFDNVKKICCGELFSVILKNDGSICLIGTAVKEKQANMIEFTEFKNKIQDIVCTMEYFFLIDKSGNVFISKYDSLTNLPKEIILPKKIYKIFSGMFHSFFLAYDGSVYGFGKNNYNQLGIENKDDLDEPTLIPCFMGKIKKIACGLNHSVVLLNDGRIFCMGNNEKGQLGLGHCKNVPVPTKLIIGEKLFIDVFSKCSKTFVVTIDGCVYEFGADIQEPVELHQFKNQVKKIICNEKYNIILMKNGKVLISDDQYKILEFPENVQNIYGSESISFFIT